MKANKRTTHFFNVVKKPYLEPYVFCALGRILSVSLHVFSIICANKKIKSA
jgi:hypothetical protein